MASKKRRRSWFSLHPLRTLAILIFLGGFAYGAWGKSVGQPADIFVVAEPLIYGDTTLTGIIQKDAGLGQEGNYYLTLSDGRIIGLDATGIDTMVSREVVVSGYLYPKESDTDIPYMTVGSINTE